MKSVLPLYGQSNYDICLQVYGSLDLLIKLCRDNGITDISVTKKTSYIYDPNLVKDKNVVGYAYATAVL